MTEPARGDDKTNEYKLIEWEMTAVNLRNYPRRKYMIDQFTQPHVTELEGETFHFVMDNGRDYFLAFTGEEDLEWHWDGDEAKHATYFCLKGDDTTYMVSFELDEFLDKHEREEHFFIIDRAQRLVTLQRQKVTGPSAW